MPQDAFSLLHTANELNSLICGAKIDRVTQPDKDTVCLYLRVGSKNAKLILCANAERARVCLTETEKPNPETAPAFCMLMRKHVARGTVKKVSLVGLERIIKIELECKNELRESGEKIIYAEIMGKFSNVILTENGVILGALKQTPLDAGNLRPITGGLKYTLPLSQQKTEILDEKATAKTLAEFTFGSPETFIFERFKGVAKSTAEEIISSYASKKTIDGDFEKIFKTEDFIKHFESFYLTPKINPNVVYTSKPLDFYITDYSSVAGKKVYFKTINQAVDSFYSQKENAMNFAVGKSRLLSAVEAYDKKLKKKLQIVLEKEAACEDMQKNKLFGELILSNLYQLKTVSDKITLIDYSEAEPKSVEIKLDKTLTFKQNAEKFFKKYVKQKKTLAAIQPQKEELNRLSDYVASVKHEIEQAETADDLKDVEQELTEVGVIKAPNASRRVKEKPSKPREYSYKGFEILVGRNNLQNDRLTLSADRTDVFVHTRGYHSSHVIVKANGRLVPDDVILYAAEICAYYSKARDGSKVPVDYTLKKFVKKPNNFKIGMVIYTNQKTVLVTPNSHQ